LNGGIQDIQYCTTVQHCTGYCTVTYRVQDTGYSDQSPIIQRIPQINAVVESTVEVYDGFCIHVGGSTYSTVQYSTG
jgi:hypothetical protein